MKERLNYIKDGKSFVGAPVNISGVVIQAESLDELKRKAKIVCKAALENMAEIINQDEPFELYEEKDRLIFHYGKHIAEKLRLLNEYQKIYGDLPKPTL